MEPKAARELAKFIRNDLEKKASVIKNNFFDQEKFHEAVFRAFLHWASIARSGEDGELRVRVEADSPGLTHLVYEDEVAFRFLPTPNDHSFHDYERRIMAMTGGRRFQVVISDLQAWDMELWDMISDFLAEFYRHTGMLSGKIQPGLFIGNYPYTPLGVHWDGDPVLTLMLVGSKTMRAWPKKLWEQIHGPRPELNYSAFNDRAFCVTGNEGDWIHCPSDFYHVFETEGLGVNFSLSFGGLATLQTPHKKAVELMSESWEVGAEDLLQDSKVNQSTGKAQPPRRLMTLAKKMSSAIPKNNTDPSPLIDWTKREGSFSLNAPLRSKRVSGVNRLVVSRPGGFFLWKRFGSMVILAANGHVRTFKLSKVVDKSLRALVSGQSVDPRKIGGQLVSTWLLECGAVILAGNK